MERICPDCGETDLSKFGFRDGRGGLKYVCKVCENERSKKWLREHPAVNRARVAANRVKNTDRIREKEKEYSLQRRATERGRLDNRLKSSIAGTLRGYKNHKKWQELTGINAEELKKHLQKTIPPGYGWEDYVSGKLQLDHKTPICKFTYQTPDDDDFKKCWSLENMQLLAAFDNGAKGRRG